MSTAYTNPFGGGLIRPSQVSFAEIGIYSSAPSATSLYTLIWPGYEISDPLAQGPFVGKLDVVSSDYVSTPLVLVLPDGSAGALGANTVVTNFTFASIEVRDSAGSPVTTLLPGTASLIYLVSMIDPGVWRVVKYGVSTGALDIANAAGGGLVARATKLSLGTLPAAVNANFTVDEAQRGTVLAWTGGVGTVTVPISSTLDTAFTFAVRNQGTGALTIATSGSDTIDGASSITLSAQESCLIATNNLGAWYTVGRGRNTQFSFTLLSKAVTGGSVVLTALEASNVVQRYTGVLVSNCDIVLPSVVQVYYATNNTTGAFTLSFKTAGVGSTVTIPAGQSAILFCDGINVTNSSTTFTGIASLSLTPGSASTPSLSFVGDATTGVFRPIAGSVSIVGNAAEVARFSGVASAVNYASVTNATTGNAPAVAAAGADTDIGLQLFTKGVGNLQVFNSGGELLRVQSTSILSWGTGFVGTRNSNTTGPFEFSSFKGRGTPAAPLTVQAGDEALRVSAFAYDGASNRFAGRISFLLPVAPANSTTPVDIAFYTVPVGVSQVNVERLRIMSSGQVRFVGLAAAPSSPSAGDMYYNSTTNKHQGYNGAAWFDLY